MRLPMRGRRESEGRIVSIEDSTLARAGEAATRLAVEETLLRRGWRVLFLDDQFGPLFGPQRPKLFDGIAVRLSFAGAGEIMPAYRACMAGIGKPAKGWTDGEIDQLVKAVNNGKAKCVDDKRTNTMTCDVD